MESEENNLPVTNDENTKFIKKRHRDSKVNKRRELQHQLEFYFSDVNLLNDKYLKKLLDNDPHKGADLKTILNFNKVKNILHEKDDENEKLKYLKKAVEASRKIKLVDGKIVRVEKFNEKEINKEDLNNSIIYVQNLPSNITHETLYDIFSTNDLQPIHVSIPRNKSNRLSKGFAFVTFKSPSQAESAISEFNNTLPKEIIKTNQNSSLESLYVISKRDWENKKEEFKKLKRELMNSNVDLFANCLEQDSSSDPCEGCLIRLKNLPESADRFDVKVWVSNLVEPTFVDLYAKGECIVRFANSILCMTFLKKIESSPDLKFKNKQLTFEVLKGEEEQKYLNKIKELKRKKKTKSNN